MSLWGADFSSRDRRRPSRLLAGRDVTRIPGQRDKILQHLQPGALAFFRMELRGEKIPPRHRGGEGVAVGGFQRDEGSVLRRGIVAMDEVDVIAVGNIGQQRRVGLPYLHRVPADLRNFEAVLSGKLAHFSGKKAESLFAGSFLARIEEHLVTDTNAEER